MNAITAGRWGDQFSIKPNGGSKGAAQPSPVNNAARSVLAGGGSPSSAQRTVELVNALSVLTSGEQRELADCEAVIEKGWETFVEVGRALAHIRDQRLYRAQYDTFAAYCRQKWQYGKSQAYRLIGAAEALAYLSPIGDIPKPNREAQVRPLIGLEQESAKLAWKRAAEKAAGGVITAKLVRQAVAETTGVPTPKTRKTNEQSSPAQNPQEVGNALGLLKQVEDALREEGKLKAVFTLLARLRKCLNGIKPNRVQASKQRR